MIRAAPLCPSLYFLILQGKHHTDHNTCADEPAEHKSKEMDTIDKTDDELRNKQAGEQHDQGEDTASVYPLQHLQFRAVVTEDFLRAGALLLLISPTVLPRPAESRHSRGLFCRNSE